MLQTAATVLLLAAPLMLIARQATSPPRPVDGARRYGYAVRIAGIRIRQFHHTAFQR